MNNLTYNTQKKVIAVALSAVYLLMCIVILFVMPKAHEGNNGKTKIGYAKISNAGFKGMKNTLKRGEKVPNRKYIAPVFPYVFTTVYGFGSAARAKTYGLYDAFSTHPIIPIQFGCLLNCCRRI